MFAPEPSNDVFTTPEGDMQNQDQHTPAYANHVQIDHFPLSPDARDTSGMSHMIHESSNGAYSNHPPPPLRASQSASPPAMGTLMPSMCGPPGALPLPSQSGMGMGHISQSYNHMVGGGSGLIANGSLMPNSNSGYTNSNGQSNGYSNGFSSGNGFMESRLDMDDRSDSMFQSEPRRSLSNEIPPSAKPQLATKSSFLDLGEDEEFQQDVDEELSMWRRKYEKLKGQHMQKEREVDHVTQQLEKFKTEARNQTVRVREVEKAHEKMREYFSELNLNERFRIDSTKFRILNRSHSCSILFSVSFQKSFRRQFKFKQVALPRACQMHESSIKESTASSQGP